MHTAANPEHRVDQSGWRRSLARAAIVLLSLGGLGGCGASVDAPDCSFFSNTCNPTVGPIAIEFPPIALVFPSRQTVQAGATATFTVNTSAANPSYQWRRSSDGGLTYADIPGANGLSYTLASAQLADDGATFGVEVRSNGVSLTPGGARLAVSSMPGVVFQDGEFAAADWAATAVAVPAQNGPVNAEEQATAGGHPGAFRKMTYMLTAGPSSLRVFNTALAASYDPAALGAAYVIDFSEDCAVFSGGAALVVSSLLVEQGGRKYIARASNSCASAAWTPLMPASSLGEADFVLVDGPACAAGQSCPDFSATAAPLRLGYVRDASVTAGSAAGSIEHGIDNWKVTVWRR